MSTKELNQNDIEFIRSMWVKRGGLVGLGFNIRQQYLEAEEKIYKQVAALDADLNSFVKMLRERDGLSEDWRLDLDKGVFVNAPSKDPSPSH